MTTSEYKCDNCHYQAGSCFFDYAKDLHLRLTPGEKYTDRECPKCGALAFPVEITTLAERLESWAQNEEMVDQRFTKHGKDCVDAARQLSAAHHDDDPGRLVMKALLSGACDLLDRYIDLCPRMNDDDPVAPALADVHKLAKDFVKQVRHGDIEALGNKWTVILRYPDDSANWPDDTYTAVVEAGDLAGAVEAAQFEAARVDYLAGHSEENPPEPDRDELAENAEAFALVVAARGDVANELYHSMDEDEMGQDFLINKDLGL